MKDTQENTLQLDILNYLKRHINEFVYLKDIKDAVNLSNDLIVRILIKKLRCKGHWIVADGRGYKLVDDFNEVLRYVEYRRQKLADESEVLAKMSLSIAKKNYQEKADKQRAEAWKKAKRNGKKTK